MWARRIAVGLGSKHAFMVYLAKSIGGTVLHSAVDEGNVTAVRVLVEETEVDRTARTASGLTALAYAHRRYGGRGHTPVEMITALR